MRFQTLVLEVSCYEVKWCYLRYFCLDQNTNGSTTLTRLKSSDETWLLVFASLLWIFVHNNIFVSKTLQLNSDKLNGDHATGPRLWLREGDHVCASLFSFTFYMPSCFEGVWKLWPNYEKNAKTDTVLWFQSSICGTVFSAWGVQLSKLTAAIPRFPIFNQLSVLVKLFEYWSQKSNFFHPWGYMIRFKAFPFGYDSMLTNECLGAREWC